MENILETSKHITQKVKGEENLKKSYKASFRHTTSEQKKRFKESKCILPISVGQEYQDGEKLVASLKLINNNFKEVVILVNDAIQWYNDAIVSLQESEEKLFNIAKVRGDEWLDRNKKFFDQYLSINKKIVRWEYWITQKNFKFFHEKVLNLYRDNDSYKDIIEQNVLTYVSRFKKRNANLDEERAFNMSLKYLLEECASVCLWVNEKCEYLLYPYEINRSVVATRKYLIEPLYPNLLLEAPFRLRGY